MADSLPQPFPIQVPAKTVEAEHALKVRNLKNLVMPPSSLDQRSTVSNPPVDPAEVAAMLARLEEINMKKLKHEMKNQVELAMKKYLHTTNPEVYGQKSWEIFDTLDFAEVCRALAVRSREAVSEKWNLQHGSLEGVELSDEDISQMRDSVDFYFHMRKVCLPHYFEYFTCLVRRLACASPLAFLSKTRPTWQRCIKLPPSSSPSYPHLTANQQASPLTFTSRSGR